MVTPYKRTGLMTASFQGARGAALSEGIRTSNALSSQLSQMSNFFFSQAAEQRTIEGTEYGSANAPTIEQIKEANKTGKDLFDFAPTVFGQAAKRAALAQIENEIIVDSTKRFDDLVFTASKNMSSPTVLRNDLDAAIAGYDEILNATSPSLANKMKAKLSMTAHGQFDAYRKSYQRAVSKSSSAVSAQAIVSTIRNFSKDLDAFTSPRIEEDGFKVKVLVRTEKEIQEFLLNREVDYLEKISGLSASGQISALRQYRDEAESSLIAKAVTEIRSEETRNYFDDAEEIATGNLLSGASTEIQTANRILMSLGDEQRLVVSKQIREKATQDYTRIQQENQLQELQTKQKINNIEKDIAFERLKLNNITTREEALNNISDNLLQLDLLDSAKARTYRVQLQSIGMQPEFSDNKAIAMLNTAIRTGLASFDTLNTYALSLSSDDYEKYYEKINKIEQTDYKRALGEMKQEFRFDPNGELYSDDSKEIKNIKNKLYQEGVNALDDHLEKTRNEGTLFDGLSFIQNFINNKKSILTANFIENDRKTLVPVLQRFVSDFDNLLSKEIKDIIEKTANNPNTNFSELKPKINDLSVSTNINSGVKKRATIILNEINTFEENLKLQNQ